jgi:hypothetical protein
VDLLLALTVFGLRYMRRQSQREEPLEFEDVMPSELNPLRLGGD